MHRQTTNKEQTIFIRLKYFGLDGIKIVKMVAEKYSCLFRKQSRLIFCISIFSLNAFRENYSNFHHISILGWIFFSLHVCYAVTMNVKNSISESSLFHVLFLQ